MLDLYPTIRPITEYRVSDQDRPQPSDLANRRGLVSGVGCNRRYLVPGVEIVRRPWWAFWRRHARLQRA